MGQALAISNFFSAPVERDWRSDLLVFLSELLARIEIVAGEFAMLDEITKSIFENKSEILGTITLEIARKKHRDLFEQIYIDCPKCSNRLKTRGDKSRQIETAAGNFELLRPYFYCSDCHYGFYPLDRALGLSTGTKQFDVQDIEAWLASELPFDTAEEAYKRCTGNMAGKHHIHEVTQDIAGELNVLDVCPSRDELLSRLENIAAGKFRRPVLMLAIDGAHAPLRPEPSPRSGKRGKGGWKESKGFRFYFIDSKRIVHLVSWHQVQTDKELAIALQAIKDANFFPEERVRLCVIGDGAPWIWNRIKEIYPNAKEVLDYYHCVEHLHDFAHAQYGKGSVKAREWVEATLVRLFHDQVKVVISGLKRMKPKTDDAAKEIISLKNYLEEHKNRVNYGAARRGGYHIGSGAIESANKFIGHVRLKRSGAWWYRSFANNILKLRCAKYNGTYDRIIEKHKEKKRAEIYPPLRSL